MSIRLKEIAQSFAGKRILVIGDAMLDCYIQGVSGRLCQEAPVPVVEHCRQLDFAGGAANAAANAASLAGESALVSVIGSDAQGERLRQLLAIAGVETTGMRASPARQTLTKQRVMCGTQMIVRFDSGTTAELDAEEQRCILASLDREFVRCDGVIVSDYGGAVLTPQIIQRLMRLNARHPRIVAIDSRRLRRFREIEPALIKPNYREAAAILDLPPAEGRGRIELVRNH
ncbi:MAG TPA: PfkB family carbohydrate kinase, partial [Planctomycetaceae bacterium]|nr:PfkB family carbohydrate kinase [Planctomycetaceae bacterium]